MARIRSLHPGQWTDDEFLTCTPFARLLALALRNEADDFGVFEWKPARIKIRLMPVDNVDITGLLKELLDRNQVVRFEYEGRSYGLIRNFCRYQRPRTPNALYPLPERFRKYAGLSGPMTASEAAQRQSMSSDEEMPEADDNPFPQNVEMENVEHTSFPQNAEKPPAQLVQFPQNAEIAAQRKEVGGNSRREEVVRVSNETLTPRARDEFFSIFCDRYPKPDKLLGAKPFFEAALTTATAEEILAGLDLWAAEWRRRYQGEIRYIPSAYDWLKNQSWAQTPKASDPDDGPPAASRQWHGPPEIRAAVVAAESEAVAQNYLDPARWDPDRRRIVTRTGIAAEHLRKISALSPYIIERHTETEVA